MRIGILTGGGDVPGLNPCIRSITLSAIDLGWEVIGFRRGWDGLLAIDPADPASIAANSRRLDREAVRGISQHGVQDIPSSSAFDGIAPDQHEAAVAQLRLHFFGEVVVVHGRDRRHAGEGESIKQRSKPALGRIRAIPHAAIAWIK